MVLDKHQNHALGNQLELLIHFHLQTHPEMHLQDVYKLLHQGVFGPQHLVRDPESARSYLRKEWEATEAAGNEALTETVSTDGQIIRVNLRPYKAGGGNWETLWQVLHNSAVIIQPNKNQFVALWQQFVDLCKEQKLPFSAEEAMKLSEETATQGYPALHHSKEYQHANKSSYRVVLLTEWEKFSSRP